MRAQQVFLAYDHTGEKAETCYRYCPACAASLSNGADSRAQCPVCGWVHYQNPAPGVVIVITQDERVLLGRRGRSSYAAGKWCLPGGYVEFGEDFLTAAIREVHEETGFTVEISSILSVCSNFLSAEHHTLVVVLHARITGGEPLPGDDMDELRWYPLAGPFPDLAFEADHHIIERYRDTGLRGAPVDTLYACREPAG